MRRAVWVLLVSVTAAAVVFLFVLPGRTLLAQNRSLTVARRQFVALTKENAALAQRISQLKGTAAIEQLARQQYGLVLPGEKAYGVLPPPGSARTVPRPPMVVHHRSFWSSLEFWQ